MKFLYLFVILNIKIYIEYRKNAFGLMLKIKKYQMNLSYFLINYFRNV